MRNNSVYKLTLAAFFLALGFLLPSLLGSNKELGGILLPMHLPVFLCALICGWQYGALIGVILPFLRWAATGMPLLYPKAIGMALELLTYGLVCGMVYLLLKKSVAALYVSLGVSMLVGRAVWGISQVILLGLKGSVYTWAMYLPGSFVEPIPGIILQFLLIPLIVLALKRANLLPQEGKNR